MFHYRIPTFSKRGIHCPRRSQVLIFQTSFPNSLNFRYASTMKVALLGAACKTGMCLSLFLKQSSLIDQLAIYDNKPTRGLATELSIIDTKCKLAYCEASEECLKRTLEQARIVMIVSDHFPQKNDNAKQLLEGNANILSDYLPSVIRYAPKAMLALVMNPINSLVPIAHEMYKAAGVFAYNRLFGVTSLDTVRANTFAAETVKVEPECMIVPVIGGSSRRTTVPLFSQATPCRNMSQKDVIILTYKVRAADHLLHKVSDTPGTPFIAKAFAAARFCMSLCKAVRQEYGIVECAYVRSCVIPQVTYFSSPLQLGPAGIQKYLGIPALSNYECKLLDSALPALKDAIAQGEALALGKGVASSETCQFY